MTVRKVEIRKDVSVFYTVHQSVHRSDLVFKQRDVALAVLWCWLVICDGLNALLKALRILTVSEVGYYLVCVVLFCFLDAMGQVSSCCPDDRLIPSYEGFVSGLQ